MAETNTNDIKSYTGEQIVLASGRLIFNSRLNDIYINSFRYINLSAGDKVTIDVGVIDSDNEQNMFLVNAPKVQFGLDRYGTPEYVVKSQQLELILNEIMDNLIIYTDMLKAASTVPPLMSVALIPANEFLRGRFNLIKGKLDNFRSKITQTI